jgi:hypothetical protein
MKRGQVGGRGLGVHDMMRFTRTTAAKGRSPDLDDPSLLHIR